MHVPSGLIRADENIELSAIVRDSEGVINRDEIHFYGRPTTNQPRGRDHPPGARLRRPRSRATSRWCSARSTTSRSIASSCTPATAGARPAAVPVAPYGAAAPHDHRASRTATSSRSARQHRHARVLAADPRRPDARHRRAATEPAGPGLPTIAGSGSSRATPRASLRQREVSYPIRIDERPVVDWSSPLDGAARGRGRPRLFVNVQRLRRRGPRRAAAVATQPATVPSLQPAAAPAAVRSSRSTCRRYVPQGASAQRARPAVEALDTYGAPFGDPTRTARRSHSTSRSWATSRRPSRSACRRRLQHVTEGAAAAGAGQRHRRPGPRPRDADVAGLRGGDRTFTDATYPYEFLVEVPYGQAGTDLTLTATATEQRFARPLRARRRRSSATVEQSCGTRSRRRVRRAGADHERADGGRAPRAAFAAESPTTSG